ncbi:hypothetical protein CYMTET_11141 [Cymbomonas tetramitiformis]|uniref:Uncharacterized protein n=1 Tax=Cymbomonas tetramitiformis TaxID=36881 RepID=A0AAE0GN20_9CHLO|nr:hypothetical protein CYMTET_11141 [Cymbomonas tetramitiformis]
MQVYLLDARHGAVDGYLSNTNIGVQWSGLHVDGTSVTLEWSSLPLGRWVHLHVTAAFPFSDDLNVMSKASDGDAINAVGCLCGRLAEVYLWSEAAALDSADVLLISQGFNYLNPGPGLLAYYTLEEGPSFEYAQDITHAQSDAFVVNGAEWVLDAPLNSGWQTAMRESSLATTIPLTTPFTITTPPPPPFLPPPRPRHGNSPSSTPSTLHATAVTSPVSAMPSPVTAPPPKPPSPPAPPSSHYSVAFDGIDDALTLAVPLRTYSLSLWLYLYTNQTNHMQYLLDGLPPAGDEIVPGVTDPYFHRTGAGEVWRWMYVDGSRKLMVRWEYLTEEQWIHVHLEALEPLANNMTLMGHLDPVTRQPSDCCCVRGMVTEVYLWGGTLALAEVQRIAGGYNNLYVSSAPLAAWYQLEEGEGVEVMDLPVRVEDEGGGFWRRGLVGQLLNGAHWVGEMGPLAGAPSAAAAAACTIELLPALSAPARPPPSVATMWLCLQPAEVSQLPSWTYCCCLRDDAI